MTKKIFFILPFLALAFLTSCGARRTTPPTADPFTTDPGVTINGITWATRNVDAPGTFAANPESAGMFFQWNRPYGWRATFHYTDIYVFFDNWNAYIRVPTQRWNPTIGWENVSWDSSIPEGTKWYAENDPCPEGWRVPTEDELRSLLNVGIEWTRINGRNGRLYGTAPYQIFLPASNWRNSNGTLGGGDVWGNYWSSTQSNHERRAWVFGFSNPHIYAGSDWRCRGMSVRCVKIN